MSRSVEAECLVVAPLAEELRPLLRRLRAERIERLPFGALYRLTSGERHFAAVIGDGAVTAERSLGHLISLAGPQRMLLLGIAGGLSPDLAVGEVVRAAEVLAGPPDAAPVALYPARGDGTVVSVDRVLTTASQKSELWRALGEPSRAVVDLESASFARTASEAGIDWAVLRAVSDLQTEDLPLDLAAASDETGHVSRARVLMQLLLRPAAWADVDRLRRRLGECAERLASEACRWLAESQPGGRSAPGVLL